MSVAGRPVARDALRIVLLAVSLAAVLWPGVFTSLSTFDAGFLASGAMEILRGGWPLRDFFVIYGPGQYYLVAAAFAGFGEDLAVLNFLHLAVMAALGTLLAVQAVRLAPPAQGSRAAAGVGVVFAAFALCFPPSPGYAALTSAALLVCAAARLPRAVRDGAAGPMLGVSAWVGLAGLLRWDFGVLGFMALSLAWLLCRPAAPWRGLLRLTGPALLLFMLAFLPFILASGALRWWEEVPWFHLREFRDWRGLEFIGPHLTLLADATSVPQWIDALSRWLAFLAPFVLALLALPLAAWRVSGRPASRQSADILAVALALLALVLLNQQRVRTGIEQGFAALVVSLPLAAYLPSRLPLPLRRAMLGGLGLAFVLMLAATVQALPSQWLTQPVALARYSGWHVPDRPHDVERARQYAQLVQQITACVPEGGRLYAGALDTSRLWVNDPMLYFLSNRRPATRWIEMEPGLTNALRAQEALVAELRRHAPRCIVLRETDSTEPNRTAVSNGPSAVDSFLREHYAPLQVVGSYHLWKRRE